MAQIARLIIYEGSIENLKKQMEKSLADGSYDMLTKITAVTLKNDISLSPPSGGQAIKGWQNQIDGI